MTQKSAQEVRQDRINYLGEEGGKYFHHLENQLYYARSLWKSYVAFFGTNQERVDLLNSISGWTAFVLDKSMRDSTLLSICRMTDPVQGPKKGERNITVCGLLNYQRKGDKVRLRSLIDVAVEKAEFARRYRNKLLAHADEMTHNEVAAFSTGSRLAIREVMDAIAACVIRFGEDELDATLITHPIGRSDDEVEIMTALFVGKGELERRQQEVRKTSIDKGWMAAREMYQLPEWLTFRPEPEVDD